MKKAYQKPETELTPVNSTQVMTFGSLDDEPFDAPDDIITP